MADEEKMSGKKIIDGLTEVLQRQIERLSIYEASSALFEGRCAALEREVERLERLVAWYQAEYMTNSPTESRLEEQAKANVKRHQIPKLPD